MQPGRDHPRVVQHEHVARTQKAGEVGKKVVRGFPGFSLQNEEAGTIAPRGGLLGNKFRREVEMEIGG